MYQVSAITFSDGLIFTLIAFFISLSIIVFIHELGHYLVGRWTGIHAEVFSLGLGPVLVSRYDSRGTRWQLALIPFGGFVKFLGDSNAAGGVHNGAISELTKSERRSTMVGAPLWARSMTVAAGPFFNFFLAILLFAGVAFFQGQVRDPLTVGTLYSIPFSHGLKTGDILLEVNGKDAPSIHDNLAFSTFMNTLNKEKEFSFLVKRGNRVVKTTGPNLSMARVVQVMPRSASSEARLTEGDVILAVNDNPVVLFDDLKFAVENSEGATLNLSVWRRGEQLSLLLTPKRVDEKDEGGGFKTVWRIGLVGGEFFFKPQFVKIDFWSAVTFGVIQTWRVMEGSLQGLYHVVIGSISTCNLSGPIGIAETSADMARQGGQTFIWFIALLSAAVGVMNLFPIPILDGGHLLLFAYEAIVGQPPAAGFLNVVMMAGFAILVSFMAFALINDHFC